MRPRLAGLVVAGAVLVAACASKKPRRDEPDLAPAPSAASSSSAAPAPPPSGSAVTLTLPPPERVPARVEPDLVYDVLAYAPDGRRLFTSGAGGTAIWPLDPPGPPVVSDLSFARKPAWARDGARVAAAVGMAIVVLDVATGKELGRHTLGDGGVDGLAWKGGAVVAAVNDGSVLELSGTDAKLLRKLRAAETDFLQGVTLSPRGDRIVIRRDKSKQVLDLATGKEVAKLAGGADYVADLAFDPTGSFVAGTNEGKVYVWAVAGGALEKTVTVASVGPMVTFAEDGKRLAVASDREVVLLDRASGAEVARVPASESGAEVAFRPDGKEVAVGGRRVDRFGPDGALRDRLGAALESAAISCAGGRVTTFGEGLLVRWDLPALAPKVLGARVSAASREPERPRLGRVSPTGIPEDLLGLQAVGDDAALLVARGGPVRWAGAGAEAKKPVPPFDGYALVRAEALSSDGRTLAGLVKKKGDPVDVVAWDPETGKRRWAREDLFSGERGSLSFSPDGEALAIVTPTKLFVLDAATGASRATLTRKQDPTPMFGPAFASAALGPKGTKLLAENGALLELWDVPGGRIERVFRMSLGPQRWAGDVVFGFQASLDVAAFRPLGVDRTRGACELPGGAVAYLHGATLTVRKKDGKTLWLELVPVGLAWRVVAFTDDAVDGEAEAVARVRGRKGDAWVPVGDVLRAVPGLASGFL